MMVCLAGNFLEFIFHNKLIFGSPVILHINKALIFARSVHKLAIMRKTEKLKMIAQYALKNQAFNST